MNLEEYSAELARREKKYREIIADDIFIQGAKEFYAITPVAFINDWCITYDPRNSAGKLPALLPFIPFPRQNDLVEFILDCLENQQNGLIEKTRDVGATWISCYVSLWLWLFKPGSSVGWGSRKEVLVDRRGDPDSIFEKIRMTIRYLPKFLLPAAWDEKAHSHHMKIINPENGASITGEAGDQIGRGGRKLIYFKDESAHYERPESIEASLSHNTRVQIDISSVNGTGNVFYRKRQSGEVWSQGKKIEPGKIRVFIFDWRHHPAKDQEWYDTKRATSEREGLLHIFAQEVDRDYQSAVDKIIIPPIWVKAAIDAHRKLNIPIEGIKIASLDVADEGGDKNSLTIRHGIVCLKNEAWGEGDTGETTYKSVLIMRSMGVTELQYDCIGVGSGIKASINILKKTEKWINKINIVKWNAGANPLFAERRLIRGDKDTPKNKDFFVSLRAQAWWNVRIRFEKTYNAVVKNFEYPADELISIDSSIADLHELVNELSQATYSSNNAGKLTINKQPSGTKSPNRADSFVMNYWPLSARKIII